MLNEWEDILKGSRVEKSLDLPNVPWKYYVQSEEGLLAIAGIIKQKRNKVRNFSSVSWTTNRLSTIDPVFLVADFFLHEFSFNLSFNFVFLE